MEFVVLTTSRTRVPEILGLFLVGKIVAWISLQMSYEIIR